MVTQQGRSSPLDLDGKTMVVIGRSSSCDVFVDESSVSRRHAVVHVHPDRVEIEDLGSQNGTRLLDVVRTGDGVETARGNETQLAAHERAPLSETKLALIGTAQLMLSSSHQVAADEAPEELRARAEDAERRRVLAALQECAGNQTRAARHLGLTRRALVRRLEKFNVPRPRRER
jgi:pSer/pThr/pTyr-binding forkhead associated (FHA) protein